VAYVYVVLTPTSPTETKWARGHSTRSVLFAYCSFYFISALLNPEYIRNSELIVRQYTCRTGQTQLGLGQGKFRFRTAFVRRFAFRFPSNPKPRPRKSCIANQITKLISAFHAIYPSANPLFALPAARSLQSCYIPARNPQKLPLLLINRAKPGDNNSSSSFSVVANQYRTTPTNPPEKPRGRADKTTSLNPFFRAESGHLNALISSKQFVKVQKQFYRDYSCVSLGAPLKSSDAPLLGDLCSQYRAILSHTSADVLFGQDRHHPGCNHQQIRLAHQQSHLLSKEEQSDQERKMAQKAKFERLPTNVVPRHYELLLQPNLQEFTFKGKTIVQVNVSTVKMP